MNPLDDWDDAALHGSWLDYTITLWVVRPDKRPTRPADRLRTVSLIIESDMTDAKWCLQASVDINTQSVVAVAQYVSDQSLIITKSYAAELAACLIQVAYDMGYRSGQSFHEPIAPDVINGCSPLAFGELTQKLGIADEPT